MTICLDFPFIIQGCYKTWKTWKSHWILDNFWKTWKSYGILKKLFEIL